MSTPTAPPRVSQRFVAAGALSAAVLALGVSMVRSSEVFSAEQVGVLSMLTASAVAVAGRWQGVALAMVWVLLGVHLQTGALFLPAELAIAFVAFACAAWGSRWVLAGSLLSIPVAAIAAAWLVLDTRYDDPELFDAWLADLGLRNIAITAQNSAPGPTIVVALLGLLSLAVPWLLGLTVRLARRSDVSLETAQRAETARSEAEADRAAAEEVARLRESQAQLARDVHDVVGHSLTVILAQAEAAQYQSDLDAVRRTLTTITDTARASLEDVRRVLHSTGSQQPVVPAEQDLHDLLAGVRAAGRDVHLHDIGEPRPLPPDRAPVVHRVLQEMLTNAVRHGAPGAIRVERRWSGDLRLEVTNPLPPTSDSGPPDDATQPLRVHRPTLGPGSGIEGMRRRLQAIGGRLDVRPRVDPPTFTVTAWIPLPGRFEESR